MDNGRVYEVEPTTDVIFGTKGYVKLIPSRIYRAVAAVRQKKAPADLSSNLVDISFIGMDTSFATAPVIGTNVTPTIAQGSSLQLSEADDWKVVGIQMVVSTLNTAVWGRPVVKIYSKSGTLVQVQYLKIEDVTDSVTAKGSADAAAISASSANTKANEAGVSASAALGSETRAATAASDANDAKIAAGGFKSDAQTAASQASGSATDAAGSKSQAEQSAITAANSADSAGSSAGAAARSATSAQSAATAAGISSEAARSSSITASATLERTKTQLANAFPDVINDKGDSFFASDSVLGLAGDPINLLMGANYTKFIIPSTTYGHAFDLSGSQAYFTTRGAAPVVLAKTYEVSCDFIVTRFGSSPIQPRIGLLGMDAIYQFLDVTVAVQNPITSTGVVTLKQRFSDKVGNDQQVTTWPTGATWLRPFISFSQGSGAEISVARFTVRDVTAQVAANQAVNAAITSSSIAKASETAAGQSAYAAEQSAITASTSASNAGVSERAAAQSETNAEGSASTASTQATVAARSAIQAQTVVTQLLPSDFSQDGIFFTNDVAGKAPIDLAVGVFVDYVEN